jgi:hypothetical protein
MSEETLTVVREVYRVSAASRPITFRAARSTRYRSAIALKGGFWDEISHPVRDCAGLYHRSHRYQSIVASAVTIAARNGTNCYDAHTPGGW